MRDAIFFMTIPAVLGIYGLCLAFNLFGSGDAETRFYKGRGDWFPIMDGEVLSTHRIVGFAMFVISVVTIVAMLATGIGSGLF